MVQADVAADDAAAYALVTSYVALSLRCVRCWHLNLVDLSAESFFVALMHWSSSVVWLGAWIGFSQIKGRVA